MIQQSIVNRFCYRVKSELDALEGNEGKVLDIPEDVLKEVDGHHLLTMVAMLYPTHVIPANLYVALREDNILELRRHVIQLSTTETLLEKRHNWAWLCNTSKDETQRLLQTTAETPFHFADLDTTTNDFDFNLDTTFDTNPTTVVGQFATSGLENTMTIGPQLTGDFDFDFSELPPVHTTTDSTAREDYEKLVDYELDDDDDAKTAEEESDIGLTYSTDMSLSSLSSELSDSDAESESDCEHIDTDSSWWSDSDFDSSDLTESESDASYEEDTKSEEEFSDNTHNTAKDAQMKETEQNLTDNESKASKDKDEEEDPDALPDSIAYFDAETYVQPGKICLMIGKSGTGKTNALKHLVSVLPSKAKTHLLAVASKSRTKKQDNGVRAFNPTYEHDQALAYARKEQGTSLIVLDDVFVDKPEIQAHLLPLMDEVRRYGQTLVIATASLHSWQPDYVDKVDLIFQAPQIYGTGELFDRFYHLVFESQDGFELWLDAVTLGSATDDGYYFMVVHEHGTITCYEAPDMHLHQD